MDDRIFLKVKLKSLAAEARIIRKEEKRWPSHQARLWEHRTKDVRSEARCTLLAYCFLRGTPLAKVEIPHVYKRHRPRPAPSDTTMRKKILAMVVGYGLEPEVQSQSWRKTETYYVKAVTLIEHRLDLWLKHEACPRSEDVAA